MKHFKKRRGAASFAALRANVACYSSEFTRPTVAELEADSQRFARAASIVMPFLALPFAPMLMVMFGGA